METTDFPQLAGIFYCEFDAKQGPKVIYEAPEGIIQSHSAPSATQTTPNVTVPSTMPQSFERSLNFHSISEYVRF